MSWYHLAILTHVIGVLLLASALVMANVVWATTQGITKVSQVKTTLPMLQILPKLFGISGFLVLLSGIWLTILNIQHGDPYDWIIVAFIGFVATSMVGSGKSKRIIQSMLRESSRDKGDLPPKLTQALKKSELRGLSVTPTILFVGVLILMIFQPSFMASVGVLLASLLVAYYSQKAFFAKKSSVSKLKKA